MLTKLVECNCKICNNNAKFLGLSTPLKALVRESATPSMVHGLVYLAHDPILGKLKSTALACQAVN